MFLDHLNPLPDWKNRWTDNDESWKWKSDLKAAEALYNQWRQVFGLVIAFAENLPEEDGPLSTRGFIYQNAYFIAPKIVSGAGDTLYIIKMENAALIRFNCRQLWEQVAFAVLMGNADPTHREVIEEALEKFKGLFRQWVAIFKKDEYEDEWGLF